MPEKNFESETPDAEQAELQKLFEQSQGDTREQIAKLFDEAKERNKKPTDIILEENGFERAVKVFRAERIEKFKEDVQKLEYADKEDFINKMAVLITPFNHDRFFDPEIRMISEEIKKLYQPEIIKVGTIDAKIHPSEWDFSLSDGTKITKDDVLLEISWPDKGGKPAGLKDVKESFRKMIDILKGKPHIKAVIGVSWMMSRGITDRLGFEKFPDIPIEEEQKISILGMASQARRDKDYHKGVSKEDVMLGAMSRDQFLERYE